MSDNNTTEDIAEILNDEELNDPRPENQPQETRSDSFIDKIIEFITGFSTDERIKLRKLKEINRHLKRLKYKFYNFKNDFILPQFAQYLYEIYRNTQNFTKYFDAKTHAQSIKLVLFDLFSTQQQKTIREELEDMKINELIKSSPDKMKAIETIKKNINEYIKSFTPEVVTNINSTYNKISDISNLITFDWQALLHKFDSEIKETNFNYKPEFESIEGKYIMDDLVILNDYIETIDLDKDWKNIYEYIKFVSEDEGLIKLFNKLIQHFKILKKDSYLSLIIRLIYKDPFFKQKKFPSNLKIVQDYIYNFQMQVKKIVDKAIGDIKKEKLDNLLLEIFHKTTIVRLKHYNERKNELLTKKGVSGFRYIDPLNYIKAFLLDICKGEIKPRIDNVLVRGTWSTNELSSDFSSLLIHYNKLTERVLEFDNSCSEDEHYGKTIRQFAFAVSHDPNAKNNLVKLIYRIDAEAEKLIFDSIKVINVSANKIKTLIDDYNSKTPKIIVDFHKLHWDFPQKAAVELTEIYKRLVNFVSLLKYFVKDKKQ